MRHLKIFAVLLTALILVSCEKAPVYKEDSQMVNNQIQLDGSITLKLPDSPVIPYHENARKYLSKENGKVHYYESSAVKNPGVDTVIQWEYDSDSSVYTVEYGLSEDFSDAICTEVTEKSISLNNLYKASRYYIRVSTQTDSGRLGAVGSFETTHIGPRVMTVDGIYNVRDIGGYMTQSGKTTLQGMIYRGGQMDGTYVDKPVNITEQGIDTMKNVMGIKFDMDLRGMTEQELEVISPLPDTPIKRYGFKGYNTEVDTESGKENLRAVFSDLADPDIYPVYIHCQGGADRTGVLCFMINALLGVDIADLIHDYEFTTFSMYGARSITSGSYLPYQDNIRKLLDRFEGDTVNEKVENLLLYVGVTPDEIASIRKIMGV